MDLFLVKGKELFSFRSLSLFLFEFIDLQKQWSFERIVQ